MATVRPLGNRILVKRAQAETTKGGIILPESAKEKPKKGEVIAVGPGRQNEKGAYEAMPFNVGDHVLFGSYAGTEVESSEDNQELLILSEDDVLGILEQQTTA